MDDKQKERLAELRAKDAERKSAEDEAKDERELQARELQAALEDRGLKAGADFAIINNPLGGVYALRKPDTRAIRNWEQASEKQKLSLEWQIGLLRHYIIGLDEKAPPAPGAPALPQGTPLEGRHGIAWAQMAGQRPGLCWQTSTAFVELMGVDVEGAQKK